LVHCFDNKIDFVLDAMNVPAGAAVDVQQWRRPVMAAAVLLL
jgi:hypothetical protein